MPGIVAPDGRRYRIIGIIAKVDAGDLAAVVGNKPGCRPRHHIEIHVVNAGLVQDHMRHFGQPVLDILNAAGADDVLRRLRVGFPECRLIHPIGLVADPVGKPEGGEHFHRPAGDAVCLSALHRPRLALDDHRINIVEGRHLRGKGQPGGTASDNQDIGL